MNEDLFDLEHGHHPFSHELVPHPHGGLHQHHHHHHHHHDHFQQPNETTRQQQHDHNNIPGSGSGYLQSAQGPRDLMKAIEENPDGTFHIVEDRLLRDLRAVSKDHNFTRKETSGKSGGFLLRCELRKRKKDGPDARFCKFYVSFSPAADGGPNSFKVKTVISLEHDPVVHNMRENEMANNKFDRERDKAAVQQQKLKANTIMQRIRKRKRALMAERKEPSPNNALFEEVHVGTLPEFYETKLVLRGETYNKLLQLATYHHGDQNNMGQVEYDVIRATSSTSMDPVLIHFVDYAAAPPVPSASSNNKLYAIPCIQQPLRQVEMEAMEMDDFPIAVRELRDIVKAQLKVDELAFLSRFPSTREPVRDVELNYCTMIVPFCFPNLSPLERFNFITETRTQRRKNVLDGTQENQQDLSMKPIGSNVPRRELAKLYYSNDAQYVVMFTLTGSIIVELESYIVSSVKHDQLPPAMLSYIQFDQDVQSNPFTCHVYVLHFTMLHRISCLQHHIAFVFRPALFTPPPNYPPHYNHHHDHQVSE